METLRDLVVSIDFDTVDIRKLSLIDSIMDEIEDALREMGREIIETSRKFSFMDASAKRALDNIVDEARQAKRAIDDVGDRASMAALKIGLMGTALVAAAAAGVAAAAPLIAAGGAIAASFTAAGVGVAGFAVVAASSLKQVFEASEEIEKAQEKIALASTAKQRIAAQKELAAIYAGMSEEQRAAVKDLQSFQSYWADFTAGFEKPVFKMFSSGLRAVEKLLGKLEPTIAGVAATVVTLTDSFNKSLDSPAMVKFFDWLIGSAADSLKNWTTTFGNFMVGFMELMQAFDPIVVAVERGFVDMSQGFQEWAAGLSESTAFQNFIEYVKTNGPTLLATFGNLVEIGGKLIEELAPVGTVVLDGLKGITDTILGNWDTMGDTILAVAAAVGTFAAITKVMTIAQWAINAALLASPLTWVAAGIALVVGAGVLLYQNWDTVKEKAGQLWEWLKEKFNGIKEAVVTSLQPVMDFFDGLARKWDEFKESIANFKMPTIGLPEWMGGSGLIQTDGSHASGLAEVKKDGYIAELHKGESVLTARQSNALRGIGMLSSVGTLPKLNVPAAPAAAPGPVTTSSVSAPITININQQPGQDAGAVAEEVQKALANMFSVLGIQFAGVAE